MRRFRIPTISNMGLPSSHEPGEPLLACDSAIFADAEVETPPPEKRPSAAQIPGLRRRNATQEEERYEDANQNESPKRECTSNTAKLKRLTALASLKAGSDREENVSVIKKENDVYCGEEDIVQVQNQGEVRLYAFGQKNGSYLRSGTTPPKVAWPRCYPHCGKSTTALESMPGRNNSSHQTLWESPNDLPALPRRQTLWHEFEKHLQSVVEHASEIRHRLRCDIIPGLQRKARAGLGIVAGRVGAFFSLLKWAFLTSCRFLGEYQVRHIQQTEKTNWIRSSEGSSEVSKNDTEMQTSTESTGMQCEKETSLTANISEKSAKEVPGLKVQPEIMLEDKKTEETNNLMMTMMTRVPRQPLPDMTDETPKLSNEDSRRSSNSQSIYEDSSDTRSGRGASGPETSFEPHTQDRSRTADLVTEVNRDSTLFEHNESEKTLSPLDQTSPTFSSDSEFGVAEKRANNPPARGTETERQPGRLTRQMDHLTRLPGARSPASRKTSSSRGATGKLKSDVRTIRDSLFRALGQNKAEPETRFASPRSARKTLALLADMLVKEHGCDVAVHKNGALKLRCEKIFSGGRRLRVRLGFQSMDAFSCNVIVCRSRDDDLQVSTTDYVAFIADMQRLFLNATSEGIHGTRSGS